MDCWKEHFSSVHSAPYLGLYYVYLSKGALGVNVCVLSGQSRASLSVIVGVLRCQSRGSLGVLSRPGSLDIRVWGL